MVIVESYFLAVVMCIITMLCWVTFPRFSGHCFVRN